MAQMTTITVPTGLRDRLKALASADHQTLAETIEKLVHLAEECRVWAEVDAAYDRLQADPQAWAEYQAELGSWTEAADGGVWSDHRAAQEEWPEYNP